MCKVGVILQNAIQGLGKTQGVITPITKIRKANLLSSPLPTPTHTSEAPLLYSKFSAVARPLAIWTWFRFDSVSVSYVYMWAVYMQNMMG